MNKLFILSILSCFSLYTLAEKELHLCYSHDSQPLVFGSGTIATAGFAVNLQEAIFAEIPNYHSIISLMNWESCQSAVKRGRIDGIAMLFYNPERAKYYLYSDKLLTHALRIYYNKSQFPEGLRWNSISQLTAYRLGILTGSSFGDKLDNVLKNKQFTIDYVSDSWLNFKKLSAKRLGIVLEGEIFANYYIRNLGLAEVIEGSQQALGHHSFHMAISRRSKRKHLIEKINHVLKKLKSDGTIDKISQRYNLFENIDDVNSK